MLKKFLSRMYENAATLNRKNILSALEKNSDARFLDMGCNDGIWSLELAGKIGAKEVFGVEIVEESVIQAEQKGIKALRENLNGRLSFPDDYFDVVHANQVIEHIADLDVFMSELRRILKPGAYAVISTENNSSWHNIFAALMGWQTFSSAAFSSKKIGIGNPWSLHRNADKDFILPWSGWMHKVIFNYRGLKEFFELYGFDRIKIFGAGYYPLPARFGRIDPRHAHLITIKAFKI